MKQWDLELMKLRMLRYFLCTNTSSQVFFNQRSKEEKLNQSKKFGLEPHLVKQSKIYNKLDLGSSQKKMIVTQHKNQQASHLVLATIFLKTPNLASRK